MLRQTTGGEAEVDVAAGTVRSLLDDLEARYPGLKARICDGDGELRRFVNLYVNQEDIRFLAGLDTTVKDGDVVSIIPAIAGGR